MQIAHAVRIAERRARSAASSSSSQSQSGDVPPRGLQNVANDCFANSVLQLLVHCAPLRDWFERLLVVIGDLESRDHKARVDVPQLVRVFAQLVHDYRHGILMFRLLW
jgi:ubiquitin C-terminal hydrolase